MEEWKEYKLGDICQTNKEQYSKKDNFSNVIYLDTGNITENTIQELQYITIGIDKLPSRARRKVYNNDIIFSNVRPIQLHYGILKNPPMNMLVSTGFTVITSNDDLCNAQFLYYFITQKEIVEHLQSIGEQAVSTYPTIKSSDIENLKIYIPSLPTQQKIANILSSLDDKIEVNRRINEQLEELAQSLFKSWFVDFEPFKDGEFVESELGMIPEGWKVGKFTDIVDIKGGGTPKTDIAEYWNGDIPFFTPKDINDVFCISTEKNITDLGLSKCSSKLYSKNTVFITARGTVGKVCMAGRDMAMNQTCYALIGKKYGQHFIYMQTISIVERMKKKANGAVFSAITTRDFDSEKIIIPSLDIVSDYLMKIEPLYESILHNQQEITHLANLRDTLLPKLMSGEIAVEQLNVIE